MGVVLHLLAHCTCQMDTLGRHQQTNPDELGVNGAAGQAVAEATLAVTLAVLQGVSEDSGKTTVAAFAIAYCIACCARCQALSCSFCIMRGALMQWSAAAVFIH